MSIYEQFGGDASADYEAPEPAPSADDDRAAFEATERQLTDVLRSVTGIDAGAATSVMHAGSIRELSGLYAHIADAIEELTLLRDLFADALGPMLPRETTVFDGIGGFTPDRKFSTRWDNDGVRTLLRRGIIGAAADPETGEVDPGAVEVVEKAMELVNSVYSLSSPKIGGLRALGADPDEYRERTMVGYRVKFTPSRSETDEGPF